VAVPKAFRQPRSGGPRDRREADFALLSPPIYNRQCERVNILPAWWSRGPPGDVIADLLSLIVGATAVPFYPIVVLVLLQGQGELVKALAFVAGNIAVRLAQGVLFGLVFGVAPAANSEGGQRLGVSTLLLIVGILLLITAVKKWQKAEDPDAPSPQWMTAISDLSAVKAVGAGTLFVTIAVKQWVFTLSAIGVISEAGLGGEYRSIPVLCVGHADARSDAYLGIRRGSATGGQAAEGSANLAGAAQPGDRNICVTNFWGVVLVQGRRRVDRLTLAMCPAKEEMS
jgi:Sap, sulfolipid-1-addressing protein